MRYKKEKSNKAKIGLVNDKLNQTTPFREIVYENKYYCSQCNEPYYSDYLEKNGKCPRCLYFKFRKSTKSKQKVRSWYQEK